MPSKYSVEDVLKSYRWLSHNSFTELNALHPQYKPGRQNYQWNLKQKAFPRIWYARNGREVLKFVERFADSRMVCFGLNPRPRIFRNKKGYVRGALNSEIEISQNLLFDFDVENGAPSKKQLTALEECLKKSDGYFLDQKLNPPVRAFTGRGFHMLFAYPRIKVQEHPDIQERLDEFRERFRNAYRQELGNLETKLDSTTDLRRLVKIYGTSKPGVGVLSKFYGGERLEDEALRDYLLNLDVPERQDTSCIKLETNGKVPPWFPDLLEQDPQLRELWKGNGKPDGTDKSRSGYDYSIVRALLWRGYLNLDELAAILALRPEGAVKKSGKDERYVRRTIANALTKQ